MIVSVSRLSPVRYTEVSWAAAVYTTEESVEKTGVVIADHFRDINYRDIGSLEKMRGFCQTLILQKLLEIMPGIFLDQPADSVVVSIVGFAKLCKRGNSVLVLNISQEAEYQLLVIGLVRNI